MRKTSSAAIGAVTVLALSACGSSDDSGGGGAAPKSDGKVSIVTSMYPLQFALEQIGGDHVEVTNLVKPGAEPHDLELNPKQVAQISDSGLFVYQKGIAGAVDSAAGEAGSRAFDVSPDADLTLKFSRPALDADADAGHDHDHGSETGSPSASGSGAEDEHAGHDHETEPGATDPHYWTDPIRYAKVAHALSERLAKADPANAATYRKNATTFETRLKGLSNELVSGLKSCTDRNLVTSHAAFGYLSQRVDMKQIPIAGISPGQEPEAATLTAISDFVKRNKISTIYTETLASPAFARTIASASGARTALLDPVEGLSDASPGKDYFQIMRANLAQLKKGQNCS